MSKEITSHHLQDIYEENSGDAGTRRSLEGLAHAINHFRAAVHYIADREIGAAPTLQQLEKASQRKRSTQRRVMLEWVAAMMLCVTMLVPTVSYYRDRNARLHAQEQQALEQRQADEALLDQVSSEISEKVPDSMQPLAELDAAYTGNQIELNETEKNHGRK